MKKDVVDSFFRKQTQIEDRYLASRYHKNDRLRYDAALIQEFLTPESTVLDLGCGTGLLEEALHPFAKSIVAVDKYEGFLQKAQPLEGVRYLREDISRYHTEERFSVILLFGVTMYISDEELEMILRSCFDMLAGDGVFIIKNQWGVRQRVVADGYSEGLQSDYYAIYRGLEEMERRFAAAGFSAERRDCYPPEMNLWDNTHEYAFILRK